MPKDWQIVPIPEILYFQEGPGVRKWQFAESGVKLLNVGNINDNVLDLNATKIHISKEEAYGKYSHFLVDEGDLLIACSGIVVENFHKKTAFVQESHLPLCLNTSTMRFRTLDEQILDIRFFQYYLRTNYFIKQLKRLITGSAQLNFGPSHVRQIDVLLPPLEDQKRIAAILDAADALRQKDRQLITKYEELTQSLFLDMFGDPVKNNKKLPLVKLGTLGKWQSGGTPSRSKPEYFMGKIPWLSSGELEQMYIEDSREHISELALKESSARLIEKGSLLLGMYDTAALKSTISAGSISCNQAIAFAKLDESLVNTVYVYYIIQIGKEHFRRLQRGVRQKNLNLSMIKSIEILYPSISLQNQFAERVEQIEKQKQLAQQSLQKSEELFNSLLQQAFKGELTQKAVLV